jgi:hypothetical protein
MEATQQSRPQANNDTIVTLESEFALRQIELSMFKMVCQLLSACAKMEYLRHSTLIAGEGSLEHRQ